MRLQQPHSKITLGLWLLILPGLVALAGPGTIKPTPGFEVVWRGEGDRFIEVARKVSRSTITLTLNAHHFHHHRRDGFAEAIVALDGVTAQQIQQSRQGQEIAGNRLAEVERHDRPFGFVLTRTVELMILEAERAAATERSQPAEAGPQRPKETGEAKEREKRQRQEVKGADRERRENRWDAREKLDREREEKQRTAWEKEDCERSKADSPAEHQPRPPVAVPPRPVPVTVRPATAGPSFQSVRASATDRQLLLDWQAEPRAWPAAAGGVALFLAVFDREGACIAQYITPERFTMDRLLQSGLVNSVPIQPTGNRIIVEVGDAVANRAAWVQFGFAPAP